MTGLTPAVTTGGEWIQVIIRTWKHAKMHFFPNNLEVTKGWWFSEYGFGQSAVGIRIFGR